MLGAGGLGEGVDLLLLVLGREVRKGIVGLGGSGVVGPAREGGGEGAEGRRGRRGPQDGEESGLECERHCADVALAEVFGGAGKGGRDRRLTDAALLGVLSVT